MLVSCPTLKQSNPSQEEKLLFLELGSGLHVGPSGIYAFKGADKLPIPRFPDHWLPDWGANVTDGGRLEQVFKRQKKNLLAPCI